MPRVPRSAGSRSLKSTTWSAAASSSCRSATRATRSSPALPSGGCFLPGCSARRAGPAPLPRWNLGSNRPDADGRQASPLASAVARAAARPDLVRHDRCAAGAIRRAEGAGVEIRPLIGVEGLHGFLDLHAALRKRKYRLLAQPACSSRRSRHFAAVQGWHPLGAFIDGRLIAATIYLRWGDVLYYKFNASALDALAVRPNNLLIWAGAKLARSLGCRALDLGPSDDDQPGLIRFKRGFGAAERELTFFRWSPPGFSAERGAEVRRLLGADRLAHGARRTRRGCDVRRPFALPLLCMN